MKLSIARGSAALAALVVLVALGACSTGDSGLTPDPGRTGAAAFSVEILPGLGSYTPELAVTDSGNEVEVAVRARGAEELAAACLNLGYDSARYTPQTIEFGGFLGAESEVVTLGLTTVDGYVPLGIAQIAASGVAPRTGDGELATVRFARQPFVPTRAASGSPTLERNKVTDLAITEQSAETATLRWTEVNKGDYNNDSLVAVSDLTPIGQNFGANVASASDPLSLGLVDGDGNGVINVSDITPIGQNFGNMITGYKLFLNAEGTDPYGDGITVLRADFNSDLKHPIIYTFVADLPGGAVSFTVKPVASGDESNPNVVPSNVAELLDEPGPPAAPTGLTAVSNESTGHQTVRLEWTASTSIDVANYVIERKLSADSDGAYAERGTVGGAAVTYSDTDPAFVEGANYDYRVKAVDLTELSSDYAVAGPVMPYFAAGPPAPRNLVADNTVHVTDAIEVRWDPPVDDSDVAKYRVYRKAPGESEFTELTTTSTKYEESYIDSGLTPGEYYEYYATALNAQNVEGEASNSDGNTPSEYVPAISITSLTTDKTTHNRFNADGVASNITVVTDEPATSYEWSASIGEVVGSGATVSWSVPLTSPSGTVEVSVTAYNGAANDSASLTLYLTAETIKSSLGDGTGHYIDFTGECLECLVEGGAKVPNRSLSYYADTQQHVLLLDRWESS